MSQQASQSEDLGPLAREAERFGLKDRLLIDADVHLLERLHELVAYVDEPYRQKISAKLGREWYFLPYDLGDPNVDSARPGARRGASADELVRAQAAMAADRSLVFPSDLLHLGLNPQAGIESAIAKGYARWMTEEVLTASPSLKAMLYLPLSDPDTCVALVERYAGHPSVAGFMIPSAQNETVHHNRHARMYSALSANGSVLAFHPAAFWRDRQFGIFNQMLSVQAISPPFYSMVHLINIVLHGLPERYPGIRWLFCEAGLSWLTFVIHRLDNEYMMRPSEAPALKRKPGDYIRDFFFTTQPLERVEDPKALAALMDVVGPEQLLYASNYPRWDFDAPSRICGLDFLDAPATRAILGGNAARLLGWEENLQARAAAKE